MNIKIVVEVEEDKAGQVLSHLQTHPLVEKVEIAEANMILSQRLLNSIENYETGKIKATPVGLAELKEMLNA